MRKVFDITMKDFKEGSKKNLTLVIPYGTVEAHGTHLPLGTDTLIMERVCEEALKAREFLLAPPVNYGVCT